MTVAPATISNCVALAATAGARMVDDQAEIALGVMGITPRARTHDACTW